jgi:hypothetical protein
VCEVDYPDGDKRIIFDVKSPGFREFLAIASFYTKMSRNVNMARVNWGKAFHRLGLEKTDPGLISKLVKLANDLVRTCNEIKLEDAEKDILHRAEELLNKCTARCYFSVVDDYGWKDIQAKAILYCMMDIVKLMWIAKYHKEPDDNPVLNIIEGMSNGVIRLRKKT